MCCGPWCKRTRFCSRRTPIYRSVYTTVCQCGCCHNGLCPRCCRQRNTFCGLESSRRPNPWRARWYQTICPCYRDPFAPVQGSHDVCCCRLSTLVMVAMWCLIGGFLLIGGLFFFFSFIFEFVEHKFFYSEEAFVMGIIMALAGFYVMSRVMRAAQWAGLDNDLGIAWAPIYCPGFVCHMCCTSRKERKRFLEKKCGSHPADDIDSWCCCCSWLDSDRQSPEIAWNRVFANEQEWEEEVQLKAAEEDARLNIQSQQSMSRNNSKSNSLEVGEGLIEYSSEEENDEVVLDIERDYSDDDGGSGDGEIEMIAMMMGERKSDKKNRHVKKKHKKKNHKKDKKKKKNRIKWEYESNDVSNELNEKRLKKKKTIDGEVKSPKRRKRKKLSSNKKKKKSKTKQIMDETLGNEFHAKSP